jgi:eukaryotic-like serine/threonine-protein kinase
VSLVPRISLVAKRAAAQDNELIGEMSMHDPAVPPSTPASSSAKTAPDADLAGRQLGDFRLLRRLGRGAMAEVYLAEQCRLQRRVAVKVLKPDLAADRVYLQRFQLEARAAASLIHANIVQIYEVGCVDNLHYIAQEYVQGQNLLEWMARHGPPDLAHTLSIMRQVAAALAKAAEQGVVHRDIKPENIMLTATGEVKVADFGLARLTREGEANDLTQVGVTLGTPLYMSPEQVEGKPLDPRSDLYSFGATCYHMLAGTPPFVGETALGVAVQHLKKRAESLETLRPDLPAALSRIVHQMLAKDREKRCPSARELLRELRRVQIEHFGEEWPEELPAWESLATEPPDPRAAATQELAAAMRTMALVRPRRRAKWVWAAALLVACAVGAALAWFTIVPESVLADVKSAAALPQQTSVWRQWYLASQIGTEAAWQSVIDYYSDQPYVAYRAKEQLALVYLREGAFDRAMDIFEELAALDDEVELKAFGLAGKCGVLSLRCKYQESADVFGQLWAIRDKLASEPMKKLIEAAYARNRSEMGTHNGQEWEKWLEEQFRDKAEPPAR